MFVNTLIQKALTNTIQKVIFSYMKTFRINQVAKITGLSKEVLRVWEKRYRLLSPERGPNRYRLYSEMDIELLKYLIREMELGQSIGELASLGKDEILARMKEGIEKEPKPFPRDQILLELEKYLLPLDTLSFEKRDSLVKIRETSLKKNLKKRKKFKTLKNKKYVSSLRQVD